MPHFEVDWDRRALGAAVEGRAEAWFLAHHGTSRLIARNFACKTGEIDLIFELEGARGRELVFVEVRARQKGGWVTGIESVTPTKRKRLSRAIARFVAAYRGSARAARVDILVWQMEGDAGTWTHYPNVRLD